MRKILAPLIVAVVVGVACSGAQALPAYASTAVRTASGPPVPTPITIEVVTSFSLGNVWADLNGMTLYRYDLDTSSKVACTGTCASTWPPLLHKKGDPALHLPPGYPGILTLVKRPNGSEQVEYDGAPLYTYVGDNQPGDTNGDGVGGVWHAEVAPATTQ
jgi:predicted lipoprotein with Yx(FWY)xxD motif